jgi:glycosyltransferase involved in cell wall biosynthesis
MEFAAGRLDALFFISNNGKQYFSEKLKKEKTGFIVSRLGIDNPYSGERKIGQSDVFMIVSCSNMIPLKRIDLIIKALGITKAQKRIQWMHFGDGILKDQLSELANDLLGKSGKISYRFMGQYPNVELLKFYNQNRIDLFINTSSTEGIPVSIMEAQSAGIPVIATNVGGVSEIVVEGTGSLLDPDFSTTELAGLIEYYSVLDENEMNEIRINAITNWRQNYNASLNYSNFVSNINSIFAATSKNTL